MRQIEQSFHVIVIYLSCIYNIFRYSINRLPSLNNKKNPEICVTFIKIEINVSIIVVFVLMYSSKTFFYYSYPISSAVIF